VSDFWEGSHNALARIDYGEWIDLGLFELWHEAIDAIGDFHGKRAWLGNREVSLSSDFSQYSVMFPGGNRAGTIRAYHDEVVPFPMTERAGGE
jgi:hypothetical protein